VIGALHVRVAGLETVGENDKKNRKQKRQDGEEPAEAEIGRGEETTGIEQAQA
jgi:hypothetical protein